VLLLLLADQPGVGVESVRRLLDGRGDSVIAVCRYEDGIGHPFAFARPLFADLASLHGDKGVWRLIERRPADVREVPVPGRIPLDVDTEADYRQLLADLEGAR
jgi:molybdenum cofactor cytidylyltransferase